MVKLIHNQSTVLHPTHMQVYGGAKYHAFWDRHLLYVLFVITTSVHVSGSYNLSAAGVGLVPVIFPSSPTLH